MYHIQFSSRHVNAVSRFWILSTKRKAEKRKPVFWCLYQTGWKLHCSSAHYKIIRRSSKHRYPLSLKGIIFWSSIETHHNVSWQVPGRSVRFLLTNSMFWSRSIQVLKYRAVIASTLCKDVVSCRVVLCCAVPCRAVLCYAVPCRVALRSAGLCSAVSWRACSVVLYRVLLHSVP